MRIRLPVQGTKVPSPVEEDPPCCGATKPVLHRFSLTPHLRRKPGTGGSEGVEVENVAAGTQC